MSKIAPVNLMGGMGLLLSCAFLWPFAFICSGQAPEQSAATIRVETALVLVDVITQDAKTLLPVTSFRKEDFRIFDDDSEMAIQSFDVGARYATRPISLWFAVICNEIDWDENGSGFMRGKASWLRPRSTISTRTILSV